MKKYRVYWIRRKTHSDIFGDGYVGITSNIKQRWERHRKHQSENVHLERALKAYDDILFEVIFEGSREHCEEIEYYLRPNKNMGWNVAEGGNIPPSAKGRQWSSQHRDNYLKSIREKNANYRTPEQRAKMYQTRKQNGFDPVQNLNHDVVRGTRWWNNGVQSKRSKEPPGDEWVPGRISWKENNK